MPRRRTASAASPPWADLPPELLREIYGHLHFAGDLVRFPTICRPWHGAVAADHPLRFPPWADLPLEALRNIAGRLHVASDSIRFHAACRDWHATLGGNPPRCCLLPWLLAPPSSAAGDEAEDQRCRCVFSKATYRAPGICFRDRRVACADGTAAWLVRDREGAFLVNPLTAERLTPLPVGYWWLDRRHRIIYDGDCVLLYDFNPRRGFRAYFVHPGLENRWLRVSSDLSSTDRCCAAACHHGGYVVCVDLANCHVLRPHRELKYYNYSYTTREVREALPEEPARKVRRCSYLLVYRGELLLASVLRDRRAGGRLSASLHELHLVVGQNGVEAPEVEWVRRDQSDSDMSLLGQDVFFLGFPSSFAIKAVWFSGEVSGGAAYFIIEDNSAGADGQGRSGSLAAEPTCGTGTGSATALVERLPAGWHDARCMWFLPESQMFAPYPRDEDSEPAASSVGYPQGFGNGSGARRRELRIYVGDLSPRVDNSRLREMFSVYGKVACARVVYDKKGRSRGFGFVTMATQKGFDKAMAAFNAVE